MPPKAKFTKDEIVDAALNITRTEGFQALTARALGTKLGSSARPIFTVFQNMDEVHKEVICAGKRLYSKYIEKGLSEELSFKGAGTLYILFAINEPKLFQLLFMTEQTNIPDLPDILPLIDENYEKILLSVRNEYGIGDKSAQRLYQHLWIYTHGIAVLCATKMCRFTGKEIEEMMSEVFLGLLKKLKEGENND